MKRISKWTLALPLVFAAVQPVLAQPGPGAPPPPPGPGGQQLPGGLGRPHGPSAGPRVEQRERRILLASPQGEWTAAVNAGPYTYLGVSPVPMPEPLRAQLDLPDGFGLVVGHVEAESPAAKAGVEANDVLHKLDDQMLVNHEQLVTLVRSKKPGDAVTLHLYRKGKPTELKATLAEKKAEGGRAMILIGGHDPVRPLVVNLAEEIELSQVPAVPREDILRKLREIIHMMEQQPHGGPGFGGPGFPGGFPGGPGGGFGSPGAFPGGLPGSPRISPSPFPGQRSSGFSPGSLPEGQAGATSSAEMNLRDNDHEITYRVKDGQKHLVAKRLDSGEVVFDGPVNTEEEFNAVPEPIRNKIKNIQIRTQRFPSGARPGFPGAPPAAPGQPQVDQ